MNANSDPKAREVVANYIIEQVLGPTDLSLWKGLALPQVSASGEVEISPEQLGKKFHDPISGEPILQNSRPEMVFGTGILHSPDQIPDNEISLESKDAPPGDFDFNVPEIPGNGYRMEEDPAEELSNIDQSQRIRPSAIGLTAQIASSDDMIINFEISGAIYETLKIRAQGKSIGQWYRRLQLQESININWESISNKPNYLHKFELPNILGEYAELQVRWRETASVGLAGFPLTALTAVVVHKGIKEDDLFQIEMRVNLIGECQFDAVDSWETLGSQSEEEQENEFLYRHVRNYAVGHGISVRWEEKVDAKLTSVSTTAIPVFHQDVISANLSGITLSMKSFARDAMEKTKATLQSLINKYEQWIQLNEEVIESLPPSQAVVAARLSKKSRIIRDRMQRGMDMLFDAGNANLFESFRLTNEAMLLQQRNGRITKRSYKDVKDAKIVFDEKQFPDEHSYGFWRPFQICFLLMNIPGLIDPEDPDREEVELIYFPTGGGKTEAYLAAAAMVIVFRRLENRDHSGVDVLMRYTLRLLTVQQFERTSGLITALEYLRRNANGRLGVTPISIGVWLGDKTTPNRRASAIEILSAKDEKDGTTQPFILSKCPWCGAEFSKRKSNKTWVGYRKSSERPHTLIFVCGDESCAFSKESSRLPIWITDEDVYDIRPSFILGTVDKFAQIAWEAKSRSIFNLNDNGELISLPPALIIQDELHLISGPLGSMVGLYETVIGELCSYTIKGRKIGPKIIASTATTRRYEQQIASLYGKDKVTLFPQAVLVPNETFFSSVQFDSDGQKMKGTAYLGINPATYATGQLAASQLSAILSQAPDAWTGEQDQIDYYSTSMWFFNSLKELGQTLTLMQSTVVSLIGQMWQDRRLPGEKPRYLDPILELTGRVSSSVVAKSLGELAIPAQDKGSIKTCLASSIMEVGVDVQRLGLLTIMSQPKLTAQYIQVSGRVGRDGANGPGLVVMLYNASRARDRSVYEHFYTYHRKLYAQVEPLSVTPFAIQTMEKGLAGAVIALYRMWGKVDATPRILDVELFDRVVAVFRNRIEFLQSSNARVSDFERQISLLKAHWLQYQPTNWAYDRKQEMLNTDNLSTALLRRRQEPLVHIPGDSSINIPQSMRNVDGQTEVIPASNVYNFQDRLGVI